MPRPGGESDKLGNRYEELWTVHNLIEVLGGEPSRPSPLAVRSVLGSAELLEQDASPACGSHLSVGTLLDGRLLR